jgi:hypothetical protein
MRNEEDRFANMQQLSLKQGEYYRKMGQNSVGSVSVANLKHGKQVSTQRDRAVQGLKNQ